MEPAPQSDDKFWNALAFVLKHEGGLVDHPEDPGGATNYGVSLRFLRRLGDVDGDGWQEGDLDRDGDVDVDDIRAMSKSDAAAIYYHQFWDRYGYAVFPFPLGRKVFDLAVNMGPAQAHTLLQRSVRPLGREIAVDGVIGPETRAAIMGDGDAPAVDTERLLVALCCEAACFYRHLIAVNRVRRERGEAVRDLSVFERGWLRRAYA